MENELNPYLNETATNESSLEPYLPTVPLVFRERSKDRTAVLRSITKAQKSSSAFQSLIQETISNYEQERGKTEGVMRAEAASEFLGEEQEALVSSLVQQPLQDEDDLEGVVDLEQILAQEAYHPNRVEMDYLRSINPIIAKDWIERQSDMMAIAGNIHAGLEETSMGDLAGDIGGLIFWSDQSFNEAEVADSSWLSSTSAIVEKAREIESISDREDRQAAYAAFFKQVEASTGNTLKQSDLKSILLNTADDRTLIGGLDKAALVFDGITVAGFGSMFLPAAIGGIIGKTVNGMAKAAGTANRLFDVIRDTNPIKTAAKAGGKDEAAEMSVAATKEPQVADALDITPDAAASNGVPYSMEGILAGASDGLATRMAAFNSKIEDAREFLKSGLVKEEVKLTDNERDIFEASQIAKLEAMEDVTNVRPLEVTDRGIKFEVGFTDKLNPETGLYDTGKSRTVTMFWDETDIVDGFKITDDKGKGLGQVKGFLASPNMKFAADRFELVMGPVRVQYQQARLRGVADELFKDAMKPLGGKLTPGYKKSKKKVDEVLVLGDQWDNGKDLDPGKAFTLKELMGGITTPDGRTIKLSSKEAESYAKQRMVWDFHHFVEDARLIDKAKRLGIREVSYAGTKVLGVPYDSARKATNAAQTNHILDPRTNRVVAMTEKELESAYDSGYRLVKTDEFTSVTTATGKEANTKWMLMDTGDIKGTPKSMLNYREGHVTRITDDGVFVVKQPVLGNVNGVETTIRKRALGLFTSRKGAEAFIKKSMSNDVAKLVDEGIDVTTAERKVKDRYEVLRDREISEEDSLSDPLLYGGGPYTGKRGRTPLFLDEEGNMPVRINAYASLQRALQHASRGYPMETLKHNLQTRWLASAKAHLPREYQNDFTQAINHITPDKNGQLHRALLQTHSYIRHVAGMPSDATIKTRKSIQSIADSLEGGGHLSQKLAKLLNTNINHNDPTGIAKTVTFHSLLGGFNMSQFIVQGLGATVAMAIDPRNFARSTKLSFAMNALDQAGSPIAFKKTFDMLTKSKLFKEKELDSVYDAWKKSGLRDDLLNTADFSQFSQEWEVTNAALQAGTLPFRMGEAAMRRYTFANAYLNKVGDFSKRIDKATFDAVLARQTDLALNMSRMNKAAWQEGAVLSVATQFRQVTAKYLEAILGTTLTPSERMALVIGQAGIFGTHGIPAGQSISDALSGYSSWDKEEFSPQTQRLISEGLVGHAMYAVGADDIGIVNRTALGDSVQDLMDTISSDTLIDFLAGPFGGHVVAGTAQAVKDATRMLSFLTNTDNSVTSKFMIAGDWTQHAMTAIPIVGDLEAASFMYMRAQQLDSKGRVVATEEERDFSFTEIFLTGAGFGDKASTAIYNSKMGRRETTQRLEDAATRVAGYIRRHADGDFTEDMMSIAVYHAQLNVQNEDEYAEVWAKVRRKMEGDSRLATEMEEVINLFFVKGFEIYGGAGDKTLQDLKEKTQEAVK